MTTKQRDAFLAHALVREQQGLLPYSLRIMWALRVKTGLRPEEAYGMHVGDIDLGANKIRIERAVSLGRIKDTKTHERRYVDVSEGLASQLADFVDFVKAEAVAKSLPEPNWLFPGRQGGLVTEADERWHRDVFKQVVHAAHLPAFVPYAFATPRLKTAWPRKPTTTLDHYAKWLPSGEQRFVNVLDTQLEKVGTKLT